MIGEIIGRRIKFVRCCLAPEARGTWRSRAVATLIWGLAVFFFAALPSLHDSTNAEELRRRAEGTPPPTFTLSDTAGTEVALEARRGHVVIAHFFATWREPCRVELPALSRLAQRAKGKAEVLAISVAEVDLRVRRFLDATPVDFPILLERDRAVAKAWKVSTLPTTFVLDADLHPRFVAETSLYWDSVDPGKLDAAIDTNAAKIPASISTEHTDNPSRGG